MVARCSNQNRPDYKHYGGRGIFVCERWLKFENFYADMGARPEGATLDRIDNAVGYEPGNCRWATKSEQSANTRRVVAVTYLGERMCLKDLTRRLRKDYDLVLYRINHGWSLEDAISIPPGGKRRVT